MSPVLLVSLSTVLAQDTSQDGASPSPSPRVVHRAVTEIEFIAQAVSATADGPEGTAVLVRTRPAGFAPMIPLRLDFDAEMSASTSQIH